VSCERVSGLDSAFLAAPDLADRCAFGDRVAGSAGLADPGFDLALAECLLEFSSGVAAVGPELVGADPDLSERVEEGQ
jgi:hypothetical protein